MQPADMVYSIEDLINKADQQEFKYRAMMEAHFADLEKKMASETQSKETDINETLKEMAQDIGEDQALEDITQSRKIF